MGLLKSIENENGIELKYHRVISICNITNVSSNIDIASYTSQKQRDIEKRYLEIQAKKLKNETLNDEEIEMLNNGISVFAETKTFVLNYDKNMNVDTAYEYLKTLDEFNGAQNA